MEEKPKKRKLWILIAMIIGIIPIIFLIMLLSSGSLYLLTVLSGSMSPAINTGDMIIISKVNPNKIEIGDIISFQKQGTMLFTHRVVGIEDGLRFITKGDANNVPDSGFAAAKDIVGKVVVTLPKIGYLRDFVRSPLGFALLIIIPGVLIVVTEVKDILTRKKRIIKPEKEYIEEQEPEEEYVEEKQEIDYKTIEKREKQHEAVAQTLVQEVRDLREKLALLQSQIGTMNKEWEETRQLKERYKSMAKTLLDKNLDKIVIKGIKKKKPVKRKSKKKTAKKKK
jgi:signal peptidase I